MSAIAAVLLCVAAGCGSKAIASAETGFGGAPGSDGTAGASSGAGNGGASGTAGSVQSGGAAGTGAAGAASDASADAGDAIDAVDSTDVSAAHPTNCPTGVAGHCSAGANYPIYPGFTLALVEEFDEPIDLVTDPVWTYSDGFGDNRYTRYTKEAITFAAGKLHITATAPAGGVTNAGYPTYAEGEMNAFPAVVTGQTTVQSGEFRTKHNNYRYGRYEFRMRAPEVNHTGNFINVLFTYRTPRWQQWREVDVQITPANVADSAGTNVVWGTTPLVWDGVVNSYIAEPIVVPDGGTIFDDFHTYAFEILPTSVTWFADGAQIRQETGTGVKLPDMSMKIMANLWVFPNGTWGGPLPTNNVYPMHSEIDWIRFYKADQEPVYPCSPTPSCLPAEDKDFSKNNAEDGLPSAAPW